MTVSSQDIIALADKHLLGNVSRVPLVLDHGDGLKVWDLEGRQYYDFLAGIATCAFGHCPDFMTQVLYEQAQTLIHVSNVYYNKPLVLLAKLLTEASGLDKAFFCNSGAEANEAAIKMARKHAFDKHGPGHHVIISALNSFHGRTMGAISATGQTRFHTGFEPMLPEFRFVPFGDAEALEAAADSRVCAVLLEPIQGEGGVCPPPEGYLARVSEICRQRGILLILDEIQTGLGRTGYDFAFRAYGIKPDILTLGKALGSGYPIGAMLAADEPAKALSPGTHSTTVGGAPLAMAVSLVLTKKILDPAFLAQVRETGDYFRASLNKLKDKRPADIAEVRGLGLILGLVLKRPAGPVTKALQELGFLVNAAGPEVLRFVPPLIVTAGEIDLLTEALDKALDQAASPPPAREV
ncbi:MAG: acetylornithine/succinylornithine family transaminase [Deltaproteobacteria bacterium]|jgi:predicted acetylornithine/succinylornithine family transaminase|nr:acetylornithine/succinylornithine family transaminase [Deltaproteobacteria bacterium]